MKWHRTMYQDPFLDYDSLNRIEKRVIHGKTKKYVWEDGRSRYLLAYQNGVYKLVKVGDRELKELRSFFE